MFTLVFVVCMMGGNNCTSTQMPVDYTIVEQCDAAGNANLKKQTTPSIAMVTNYICLKR